MYEERKGGKEIMFDGILEDFDWDEFLGYPEYLDDAIDTFFERF